MSGHFLSHTLEKTSVIHLLICLTNGILEERVHLIVCDNASNMVKAMRDGNYLDTGYFAHTLQLVIHDAVFSQKSVSDTLAVHHSIAGHFKHSSLACAKLKKIQMNLGIPEHRLKQDLATRWNSTLYTVYWEIFA